MGRNDGGVNREFTALWELHEMDCRLAIPMLIEPKSVHTCVTSPPYFGLRDYEHDDQIGLEPTPEEFIDAMVAVFRLVRDVLRDDGTLWLNLGDSYTRAQTTNVPQTKNQPVSFPFHAKRDSADGFTRRAERPGTRSATFGLGPKQLLGIPWRTAFALQQDGWVLRQEIIWEKPNAKDGPAAM